MKVLKLHKPVEVRNACGISQGNLLMKTCFSIMKFGVKQSSGLLQGDFLHQTCLIERNLGVAESDRGT
jgi:hypothetical protein